MIDVIFSTDERGLTQMNIKLSTIVVAPIMFAAARANAVGGPSGDIKGKFVIILLTRGNIK